MNKKKILTPVLIIILLGVIPALINGWGCSARKSNSSITKIQNMRDSLNQNNSGTFKKVNSMDIMNYSTNSHYQRFRFFLNELTKEFVFLQPYINHFPIVLLFLSPVFFVLKSFNNRSEYSWMWKFCLWTGWITSALTNLSSYLKPGGVFSADNEILIRHAIAGELTFWLSGLTLGFSFLTQRWKSKFWIQIIIFTLLLITCVMAFYSDFLINNNLS